MNSRNKKSIVVSKVSIKPCANVFGIEKKNHIILKGALPQKDFHFGSNLPKMWQITILSIFYLF